MEMTETEKMLAGKIYDPSDQFLLERRTRAHVLCRLYNETDETEPEKRKTILDELLPQRGEGSYLQGPIYFDYGLYITVGENFYANFNFTVLDCCRISIGDNVFIGPNASLVAPIHPLCYQDRNLRFKKDGTAYDLEYAKPITIGNNCWLASNVTIIGGVTIGDGCVIGAGSVVTKDIPANYLAVGNPCRVLRAITEKDRLTELEEFLQ